MASTSLHGFSLALVQHKEKDFLVAFGGSKKEASNQVEVLITEKNESAPGRQPTTTKHSSSTRLSSQLRKESSQRFIDSIARQNLASAIEHGSERKSLSESLILQDYGPLPANVSLRHQFDHEKEFNVDDRVDQGDDRANQNGPCNQMTISEAKINMEELVLVSGGSNKKNLMLERDDMSFLENSKSESLSAASNIYHYYETKVASLIRKFGILEGQLAAALNVTEVQDYAE